MALSYFYAVGQSTEEEVKLHSICFFTVKVLVVGVGAVPFRVLLISMLLMHHGLR